MSTEILRVINRGKERVTLNSTRETRSDTVRSTTAIDKRNRTIRNIHKIAMTGDEIETRHLCDRNCRRHIRTLFSLRLDTEVEAENDSCRSSRERNHNKTSSSYSNNNNSYSNNNSNSSKTRHIRQTHGEMPDGSLCIPLSENETHLICRPLILTCRMSILPHLQLRHSGLANDFA